MLRGISGPKPMRVILQIYFTGGGFCLYITDNIFGKKKQSLPQNSVASVSLKKHQWYNIYHNIISGSLAQFSRITPYQRLTPLMIGAWQPQDDELINAVAMLVWSYILEREQLFIRTQEQCLSIQVLWHQLYAIEWGLILHHEVMFCIRDLISTSRTQLTVIVL